LLTLAPLLALARPALAVDVDAPPSSGVPNASTPNASAAAETANVRPANVVEAEQLASQAFEAYERKEYPRAIELYQKALDAASSSDILYNIARVYDVGLHDSAHATEYYRRYLADPKAQSPRRQLAEERVAALQPSPLNPPLGAAIETDPAVAIADTAPPPHESAWTWRETSAVALAGTGVIALGIGTGFAISAAAQSGTWKHDCEGNVCQTQRGVDAAHTAADRAQVATIALAAGGALLAGGAAIWLLGSRHEESPRVALQVVPVGPAAQLGASFSSSF
jgi:tetratricopeptide (TPR) repeat protein